MIKHAFTYQDSQQFSKLILDYIAQQESLSTFYSQSFNFENIQQQAQQKLAQYKNNAILYEVLIQQYEEIEKSEKVSQNLAALAKKNAVTITTGHQLNLFTGPLYFIYKILNVITLCESLNKKQSEITYIPIYWMATEDHDFEEINHFHYEDKTIRWNSNQKGAVGHFKIDKSHEIKQLLLDFLPPSNKRNYLINLWEKAYCQHQYLHQATRFLVDALMGEYGLLILDANDSKLKRLFLPYMIHEIQTQSAFNQVNKTINELEKKGYNIQVNPREINLFYLEAHSRNRIIKNQSGNFEVLNSNKSWTETDLIEEMNKNPARFSPNVLLRPLYQEVILPNVCYIGGAGEISYWLELKSYFEQENILFPILKLRSSILLLTQKNFAKWTAAGFDLIDLFQKDEVLFERILEKEKTFNFNVEQYKQHILSINQDLENVLKTEIPNMLPALGAYQQLWMKKLTLFEKKIIRNHKKNNKELLGRIHKIKQEVLLSPITQERYMNYTEVVMQNDIHFIKDVKTVLNPFQDEYLILIF